MNSTARDITEFLDLNGFGTAGTDLFAYEWNQDVDAQVCLIDSEGFESEVPNSYRIAGLQILARGEIGGNPNDTFQIISAIDAFLVASGTIELNDSRYVGGVFQTGSVGFVGRDEDGRSVYSANYYVYR